MTPCPITCFKTITPCLMTFTERNDTMSDDMHWDRMTVVKTWDIAFHCVTLEWVPRVHSLFTTLCTPLWGWTPPASVQVQCCFTSTETVGSGSRERPPPLSCSSWPALKLALSEVTRWSSLSASPRSSFIRTLHRSCLQSLGGLA